MESIRRVLGVTLVSLLAVAGCGTTAADEPGATPGEHRSEVARAQVAVAQADAAAGVVTATDRAGLLLLAQADGETVVTSPASLVVALGMLAEGADGISEQELDALLGAAGPARGQALNALLTQLERLGGDPAVFTEDELPEVPVVHQANNVVVHHGFEPLPAYLDSLAGHFGGGVQVTDLTSPEGTKVLDAWVREHTGGLIEESAIQPDEDLRLVLQNAVLLAARWDQPFDANLTHDQDFTLPGGEPVSVPMMTSDPALRQYAEQDGWQAVRLDYTGGELAADIILPPAGTDPATIDPDLLTSLTRALDSAMPVSARVTMPTLDLASEIDLMDFARQHLPSLPDALLADLSRISPEELALGQAVQQAVLQVDEDGTVAAAVTEVGIIAISTGPEPEVDVRADRPHLIRISDTTTGWALFLTAVQDPRG